MVVILPYAAAWCGHTPESREWAEDIQAAFDAMDPRMKIDGAAAQMRVSREELSKQLAGTRPLNLWRLGYLSVEFHALLLKQRALRAGGAFLTRDDLALIRGFVGMGPRAMVKMLPETEQERRQA